ncbi:DNMBP-like protein [Mya arenaria]|uniref:Dynamin-binding protein n=1 Tax=Mya arenaria TaxID=6604 RepID=A0ABY7E1W7_MYAAR|nr:DNMBP-like protein [Mya arenaria]
MALRSGSVNLSSMCVLEAVNLEIWICRDPGDTYHHLCEVEGEVVCPEQSKEVYVQPDWVHKHIDVGMGRADWMAGGLEVVCGRRTRGNNLAGLTCLLGLTSELSKQPLHPSVTRAKIVRVAPTSICGIVITEVKVNAGGDEVVRGREDVKLLEELCLRRLTTLSLLMLLLQEELDNSNLRLVGNQPERCGWQTGFIFMCICFNTSGLPVYLLPNIKQICKSTTALLSLIQVGRSIRFIKMFSSSSRFVSSPSPFSVLMFRRSGDKFLVNLRIKYMRPDGAGYVGSYVRAIHDFSTNMPAEVSLTHGDVFKVTKAVDKNWLHGTSRDREGNFPSDFVEKIQLPLIEEGQKLFAAVENFPAQQDGDLEFRKGDIIVGLNPIDDSWWQGQIKHTTGMFPVTHVMELELSGLLQQRSKSVHSAETLFAQALVDSVAQLDEELSFQAGDIITVTEVVDEDWYVGQCRGRSGMFLASCVQLLNEEECNCSGPAQGGWSPAVGHDIIDGMASTGSDTTNNSTYTNDNQQSINHVQNGRTNEPPSVMEAASHNNHTDSDSGHQVSYTSENTKAHMGDTEAGVTPYARTLYPFNGEMQGELSFEANDIVTLIQHVDESWIEGEIDGKIGLCPANYVEIIVDCPYAFDNEQSEKDQMVSVVECDTNFSNGSVNQTKGETVNQDATAKFSGHISSIASESKNAGEESYALVLYTFQAEAENDLSVQEGDTVIVVRQDDDNWVLVRNDAGQSGMCPLTYIEMIGAPPPEPGQTNDANDNEVQNKAQLKNNLVESENRGSETKSESVTAITKHLPQQETEKRKSSENESKAQANISKLEPKTKPVMKPKPSLAPKPNLKPKPSLAPKPFTEKGSVVKPVSFDMGPSAVLPKSNSTKCLSEFYTSLDLTNQTVSLSKAKSMYEINHNDKSVEPISESNKSDGSTGSNSSLNSSFEKRQYTDSKKMFENMDLSKPLDNILQEEFVRARKDADTKSRSGSNRSSGSSLTGSVSQIYANLLLHPLSLTARKDCEKSRGELEQMKQTLGGNDKEIHDNVQFYTDNIKGLKQELNTLREHLADLCPSERQKMDAEKLAMLRQEEEARQREERARQEAEAQRERQNKRERVIHELIQTEKDFISSLNLINETFLGPSAKKHRLVDVDLLFGNLEEVDEVSQKLLTRLEDATHGKDFHQQVIGTSFTSLAEDMKNVYAPYCRNHDDVITLIEKYNQDPEIKAHFEVLLDQLRENHVVFDLEALLIKPVQRILKYPLLLSELFKATEEDHADKRPLQQAIQAMTDVAQAINEYKRRKDLDKLSKLSLHSIKKKSSRIKERFSANMGFIDQTRDAVFDQVEGRYRHLEKTARLFVRDVQAYIEEVQSMVNIQEGISANIEDFYGEKRDISEVLKYQAFCNKMHMTFLPNFHREVDDLVIIPLTQMLQMFDGPSKVIQKRYDKLLDYDNLRRKAQSDKSFEKAMQSAKQNYEALNAQLVDEMPQMFTLGSRLLRDCIASFLREQRRFTDQIVQEMYSVVEQQLQFLSEEGLVEQFNIRHSAIVDRLALLSFMPRTFSPRVADAKQEKRNKRMSLDSSSLMLKSMEAVPQVDSQRVYVTQQYTPSKLFKVTETHVAMDSMDISVCGGDVVGVIMDKDPMGNKERWFVDNGAIKGFMPRKLLAQFESSPPRPILGTDSLLLPVPVTGSNQYSPQPPRSPGASPQLRSVQEVEDDIDFALEEEMTPDIPDSQGTAGYQTGNEGHQQTKNTGYQAENAGYQHDDGSHLYPESGDDVQLYYAEFPFSARNSNEVTLFEHQVLTVLAPHDENGNTEWWYVEADGTYGYAPAKIRPKKKHKGCSTKFKCLDTGLHVYDTADKFQCSLVLKNKI